MIKNFDWSKLQRKNEPNNRVSVCGNGIEDLAGHVSLVEYHLEEAKEDLSKLSARFTALIQQNSALAADNERLSEDARLSQSIIDSQHAAMASAESRGVRKAQEEIDLLKKENERLTEELIRACAELSGIKKQEPYGYFLPDNGGNVFTQNKENVRIAERFNWPVISLYTNTVHQHSFTISGIGTFYADSELEITYLERLHGVGGMANLREVTDER